MNRLGGDYIKYLQPAIVSKINSLELKARLIVEGFMAGLHKSPYHGFSVEFSQRRQYMQGDPLKNIDWKAFGKTDKYYVKQYEEETNLSSHILLDISESMNYTSGKQIRKIEYASLLAASLSYLMIKQQDAVGISLYAEKVEKYIPPKSSRSNLAEILKLLSSVRTSGTTNSADSLKSAVENIRRKGLAIIISDLFDDPKKVIKAIKRFNYKKNETIVFQIVDPLERSFDFGADAVFKDMETLEEISTQPYHIQKAYQNAFDEFTSKIKDQCLNAGIEYNLLDTSISFDKALLSYFKKRERLY